MDLSLGSFFLLCCVVGQATDPPEEIVCEGQYTHHLQGVTGDGKEHLFWSFTTTLVKTNLSGEILARVDVPFHHGDLCHWNGHVYVAHSDLFNKPGADSKIYVYRAEDLSLSLVKDIPAVTYGAGGIDQNKGRFFVIGGLPQEEERNYVYEYDDQFNHVKTHIIESGYTRLGIQTACHHDGKWWFGCYPLQGKKGLLVTDESFQLEGIYDISPAIGLIGWGEGRFLMAKHFGQAWQAKLSWVVPDPVLGLKSMVEETEPIGEDK